MDIRFEFCLLPQLISQEKVVYFKRWVWGASFKSYPTYRVFFSLPPLWEEGFYVTDRRILIVTYLFRLFAQEYSLWFPGKGRSPDSEFVKEVRVGEGRVFGKYLEIISEDPIKHWYRSRELRSRIFMRNAGDVCKLISDQLERSS